MKYIDASVPRFFLPLGKLYKINTECNVNRNRQPEAKNDAVSQNAIRTYFVNETAVEAPEAIGAY